MSFLLSLLLLTNIHSPQEFSFIIEVEEDPHEFAEQIEVYHPQVEILAIYDTIFNGVAIKTDQRNLEQIKRRTPIKQSYSAQTYHTQNNQENINQSIPFLIPEAMPYSGKGVKVGVIDTGVDYQRPPTELSGWL